MRPDQVFPLVLGIVIASTLIRLVYVIGIADYAIMESPDSGPDSPVYSAAAFQYFSRGLFAPDVQGVPFWPAGYPLFVALTYMLLGPDVVSAVLLQVVIVAVGMVSAYRLVARELSPEAGVVTVVLLALSPAFGFSATVFMYEPLLAVAAVVSIDLVSQAVRERDERRRNRFLALGFLVAGLGAMLQPKLLAVGAGLLAWALWRTHRMTPLLCALALAIGPAGLIGHNVLAGNGAVVSANLGITMLMGASDHATGGYVSDQLTAASCGDREPSYDPELDKVWRQCALDWMRSHPARTGLFGFSKAAHFWFPFSGAWGQRGTWQHPLDHRRWLPSGLVASRVFEVADLVLGGLWALVTIMLIAGGTRHAWRNETTRQGAVLLLGPVLLFMLVSVATIGDARFRLPVAPLYSALIAYRLVPVVERGLARIQRPPVGVNH